ncbi:cytochrome C [Geomonas nitrogeniifigens]|uniref:Cytochrome C n=1 Tax=Geomonas diazotrophica TaxID=2843197 RepID=A0ABX8JDD8_9BACT|nr:cytochrome C [Geomonas nitrogeniifigens]QWV96409.1 cytochrome C [Geomonas nitrogeniifigens]QXE85474.1 cytochrome C [Geomonas nitrogeniifigens]
MKRTRKSSLLTGIATVAGVAMGAGMALAAAHDSITLYTYEEVAQQFGQPAMPVMANRVNNQGMPYSPKQTCTGGGATNCHGGYAGYDQLSKHAFHAALGWNEWMDNDPSGLFIGDGSNDSLVPKGTQTGLNPQKPWLQSHGHNGKW